MIYYLYESHTGGFYFEYHLLPETELYCTSCGDSDTWIGSFENENELRDLLEEEGLITDSIEEIVGDWKIMKQEENGC